MGLYNFKDRFVAPILAGEKTHTIRAERKHPDKPGKIMHLYTGLRTKKAKLLFRVPCVKVAEIRIYEPASILHANLCKASGLHGFDSSFDGKGLYRGVHLICSAVIVDDVELSPDEIEALARRDGFSDFQEMMKFWDGRLPFDGHIIAWDPNPAKRSYGPHKSRKQLD
jgi:hypothetical protein